MDDLLNFEDFNLDADSNQFINSNNTNADTTANNTGNDDTPPVELNTNTDTPKGDNNNTNTNIVKPNLNTPSDEDSTISVFARMLQEEGVLPLEDEDLKELKSVEDLKKVIGNSIAKFAESKRYEGLSPSQKRFLGAVEAGIPQNEFEQMESNLRKIETDFSDDRLNEDAQTRFNAIASSYILKGIPKEKAIKMANASFQMQTDIEDAFEARELLKNDFQSKYDTLLEQKKEAHQISINQLKEKIDTTEMVLGALKLTPKMKEEIHKNMVTKLDTDDDGKPLNKLDVWIKENPIDSKIVLNALFVATNGFKNLGRLGDVAKNKTAAMLEEKLRSAENLEFDVPSFKIDGNKFDINI